MKVSFLYQYDFYDIPHDDNKQTPSSQQNHHTYIPNDPGIVVSPMMNQKTFRIKQRRILLIPVPVHTVVTLPVLRLVVLIVIILSTSCWYNTPYTGRWIDPSVNVIAVVNGLQSELVISPSVRSKLLHHGSHHSLISPQEQQLYPISIGSYDNHLIQQQQQQHRLSRYRYNNRHRQTKATTIMMMTINNLSNTQLFNSRLLLPVLRLRGGMISNGSGDAILNERISTGSMDVSTGSNYSNINDISTTNDTSSKVSLSSSSSQLLHEMIAEVTGTYMIVQIGTAAIMTTLFVSPGIFSLYAMAMIWSISITIAIYCTRNISGAHLNPAISIAIALVRPTRHFNCYNKLIPYIVSQYIGAILASITNLILYGKHIVQYETSHHIIRSSINSIPSAKAFGEYYFHPITTTFHAFMIEMFGTFILSSVIFNLTHPKNNSSSNNNSHSMKTIIPPIIGSTVGILICIFGPLTQAGFNPARDYGPRIVAYFAGWKLVAFTSNFTSSFLVYVIGPIIGAILGAYYTDRILMYEPITEIV